MAAVAAVVLVFVLVVVVAEVGSTLAWESRAAKIWPTLKLTDRLGQKLQYFLLFLNYVKQT